MLERLEYRMLRWSKVKETILQYNLFSLKPSLKVVGKKLWFGSSEPFPDYVTIGARSTYLERELDLLFRGRTSSSFSGVTWLNPILWLDQWRDYQILTDFLLEEVKPASSLEEVRAIPVLQKFVDQNLFKIEELD